MDETTASCAGVVLHLFNPGPIETDVHGQIYLTQQAFGCVYISHVSSAAALRKLAGELTARADVIDAERKAEASA